MKKMMFFLSLCFIMLLGSCSTSSYYTSSLNTMDGIYYRPSKESKEAIAADESNLKSLVDKTATQVKKFSDTVVLTQNSSLTLNTKPGEQYAVILDGLPENTPDFNYNLNINIDCGWNDYGYWNNYWGYCDPWYSWHYPYSYYWRWGRPYYPYYWGTGYWGPWRDFYFGFGYDPWYWDWYYPYYNYGYHYPYYDPYYPYYHYYNGGYYSGSSVYYGKRGVRNSSTLSTGIRQSSGVRNASKHFHANNSTSGTRNTAGRTVRSTSGVRSGVNIERNSVNLRNINSRQNDNVSGRTTRGRDNSIRNADNRSRNIASRRTVLNQIKRGNDLNTERVHSSISETGRRSDGINRSKDIYFNSGNNKNSYKGSFRNDRRSNTYESNTQRSGKSNLIYRRSSNAERNILNNSSRQNSNIHFNNNRSNYNTNSYRSSTSSSGTRSYSSGSSSGGVRSSGSSGSSGSVRSGGGSRTRR